MPEKTLKELVDAFLLECAARGPGNAGDYQSFQELRNFARPIRVAAPPPDVVPAFPEDVKIPNAEHMSALAEPTTGGAPFDPLTPSTLETDEQRAARVKAEAAADAAEEREEEAREAAAEHAKKAKKR